jgi:pilus assembly protein Flp/PilA
MPVAQFTTVAAVAEEKVTAIRTHGGWREGTRARRRPMKTLIARLITFVKKDDAQDLIEYALLVGLISLVAVIALTNTGSAINTIFTTITTKLQNAAT